MLSFNRYPQCVCITFEPAQQYTEMTFICKRSTHQTQKNLKCAFTPNSQQSKTVTHAMRRIKHLNVKRNDNGNTNGIQHQRQRGREKTITFTCQKCMVRNLWWVLASLQDANFSSVSLHVSLSLIDVSWKWMRGVWCVDRLPINVISMYCCAGSKVIDAHCG